MNMVYFRDEDEQTGYMKVIPGDSSIFLEEYDLEIKGRDNDGITYFFIPAYINLKKIDQGSSFAKIYTTDGIELTDPLPNQVQDIFVSDGKGNMTPWKLGIYCSDNLYTMDIILDGTEYYEVDHDYYSNAIIAVYSPAGRRTYYDNNIQVKGRGNSTWPEESAYEKRPYQIKLSESISLCGMKKSDKWALIANADDDTKLRDKLAYDLAADMDMEYAIESDWVDLYINNEYMGNYLLCHEPDIGGGDLDIGNLTAYNNRYINPDHIVETDDKKGYASKGENNFIPTGGYLIEKQIFDYYTRKKSGFKINDNYFSIKSPGNASINEIEYLQSMFYTVDDSIHSEDDRQLDFIDAYSFSRQFLLSEIALNPDAAITSYYFYKKPADGILYAGPCWDYDGGFGSWDDLKDYTASIVDVYEYRMDGSSEDDPQIIPLDWDRKLLENAAYYSYVKSVFGRYVPVYEKLCNEKIDKYYNIIKKSLEMDYIRWHGYEENDMEIANAYKYLKFFLYKRLGHLAEEYGESIHMKEPELSDGSSHTLSFVYEDGIEEEIHVIDGAQLMTEDLPDYNHSIYDGWRILKDGVLKEQLSYYNPIYEDMTLVLGDY